MKYLRATVLSFVVVLGAIRSFHIYQISAPTPDQAVSKYFAYVTKDSPMEGQTITVVSTKPTGESKNVLTVLFRARGPDPDMSGVGYALTKKNIFGWYVERSQIYGKSPQPEDVIVQLDQFDQKPVIYGQVFLTNATHVEAIFSDSGEGQRTVASEIPDGNFALFGSQYQELLEFKILDSSGRVLKQFTKDELLNE
jgi:hypothetical protein